jgi:hypothetical protein
MCSPSQLQVGPADGSINSSDFVTLIESVNDRREIEVDDIKKPLSNWLVRLGSSFGRLTLSGRGDKSQLQHLGCRQASSAHAWLQAYWLPMLHNRNKSK